MLHLCSPNRGKLSPLRPLCAPFAPHLRPLCARQIRLDTGGTTWAPVDIDEVIRKEVTPPASQAVGGKKRKA